MRGPTIYAVYKGDELVAVGTSYKLAGLLGVRPATVKWWASPTCRKRAEGRPGSRYAIRVEE